MRAIGVRTWAALAFVVFLAASTGVAAQGGALDSLEIVTSTGRHVCRRLRSRITTQPASADSWTGASWRRTMACCLSSTARLRCPSG